MSGWRKSRRASPGLAAEISGKVYRFPDNPLEVRSLSLNFAAPHANYGLEVTTRDPTRPLVRLAGQIGLGGLYRKTGPTIFGVRAVKGRWLDPHSFDVDVQYLGTGEQRHWVLSFEENKITLRGEDRAGNDISVQGEAGG